MILEWEPAPLVEMRKLACVFSADDPEKAYRFVNEIEEATGTILRDPETPREFERGFRKMRLESFPYTLIYTIQSEYIWIVSLVHQNRHPDYWKRNS
ncbi:MAG: type II toxin-antitoxin system RelE/ParE family toxin [Verrucomicrobiales bacterium]|nr:type II toxin-antitoxin system RelE/ParE family toxin [Verrucomicrobiales bacterium]